MTRAMQENDRYLTLNVADIFRIRLFGSVRDINPTKRRSLCGFVEMCTKKPLWISSSSGMIDRRLWGSMKTGIRAKLGSFLFLFPSSIISCSLSSTSSIIFDHRSSYGFAAGKTVFDHRLARAFSRFESCFAIVLVVVAVVSIFIILCSLEKNVMRQGNCCSEATFFSFSRYLSIHD